MADVTINLKAQNQTRAELRDLKEDLRALERSLRNVARAAEAGFELIGDLRRAESERLASLAELEADTAAQIERINERKAERLGEISERIAEAERARIREIEGIFADARAAEIAARQGAADAITEIESDADVERAAVKAAYFERIAALEEDYTDDVAALRSGLVDRENARTAEIQALGERAAADRLDTERRYQEDIADINRDLVDAVRDIQDEIVDIETETAAERQSITQSAIDARLRAEQDYQQDVLDLQLSLGRELEQIEERRERTEVRRAESLEDLEIRRNERFEDLERELARDISDAGGDTERIDRLNLAFTRDVEDLDISTARRAATIKRRAARDAERFDVAEAEARAEAGVDPIFEPVVTALEQLNQNLADQLAAINAAETSDLAALEQGSAAEIAAARQEIVDVETAAGTTFDVALAALPDTVDASTAALNRFQAAIASINEGLALATDAVLAEGTADRAATATAITERGTELDAAVTAETDAYRAERLAITGSEAADIEAVETDLTTDLADIDQGIDDLLAEVRADKLEFDTEVFNDIREIEREAATDIAEVRADAAAMRAEIEALAAEARNNAWKDAILKVANVGVRVTGGVVGGIVAGPAGAAAGERIGGVIGGLVEDAGQELFHDPQNDLLAFRAGQQAARGTSPAFSPNAVQRQNAADFSEHFGAGFVSERQQTPESVSERPIIIELHLSDRMVQEFTVRQEELRGQDRLVGRI